MTAEIAILNKDAIALAADSAVTIEQRAGRKIYNTANKLFMLSKYQPVGMMIYGSSTLMGIPWETIIKRYRSALGKKKFSFLKEYTNDFINFLKNNELLFPDAAQNSYFLNTVHTFFLYIQNEIDKTVKNVIQAKGSINDDQIKNIVSHIIKKYYDGWNGTPTLPQFSKDVIKKIHDKYNSHVDRLKNEIFKKIPFSKETESRLKETVFYLFTKDRFILNNSGVVIAGFGDTEVFPSIDSFLIECIVNNELKFKKGQEAKINLENSSSIITFAQKEMVQTFMEGIDPTYLAYCKKGLFELLVNKFPESIAGLIKELNNKERLKLKEELQKVSKGMLDEFEKSSEVYRIKQHVSPVTNIVSVLPKDELAAMAESLVNLTSFKRRVSMDAETVGGPIDVAVISKGDGFIWIKRKHYFRPELNQHFFSNYYLKDEL